MGPRRGEDTSRRTPGRRPTTTPTTCWCAPSLCIDGRVEVELVCEPVFDYGRVPAEWTLVGEDRHTADATGAGSDDPAAAPTWRSASRATACAPGTCSSRASSCYCALSWAEGLGGAARRRRGRTRGSTRRRASGATGSAGARIPDHRWRDPIQRSALAIKGLTYMPTGATVAALTTSLPETPGGERNWDYRYTWMRDSTFTLQALHWLNLDWEADEFMQFVADLEPNEDGALQIMYGIDGRRDLTESTRDDLSGYAGARPVRIGNGAFDQRQNDVFGAVLDSILLHTRRSQRLPRRLWPIVQAAGRVRDRRSGASPTRASGRRAASRSTTCRRSSCAGSRMDRAAKLADIRGDDRRCSATWRADGRGDPAPTSSSTASTSAACCASTTTPTRSTPRRCWRRSSASCPATTSGCATSVLAIADELTEDGFVLRYRTDETDDGLSGKEGTFLICSFWLVSALAIVGERPAGPRPDGAAAAGRLAARALRRGVRRRAPAATSATSRRRSRTWR